MNTEDFYPEYQQQKEQKELEDKIVIEDMKYGRLILAVFLGVILAVGGFAAYTYYGSPNQMAYEQGYANGLLYTQQSGNVAYVDNSTGEFKLSEVSLEEICNNLNSKQEVNQNG